MVPLSVLDLAPIVMGGTAVQSLHNTLDLARNAEKWGYHRYWLAEHHNMTGIASAATSVVIGYVASGTSKIRVGAGGIMLPNHAPLVVAEQFGTLATLYPDRIDLGLGRAPGTDPRTARALRRSQEGSAESFPQDVVELLGYFRPAQPGQAVQAVPGAGVNVAVWLLGSSLFSAHLAARLGRPFAFASHFAPDAMMEALRVYRANFQPSEVLAKPHAMIGVNVVAADTDAEAQRLFTSVQQVFVRIQRGSPGPLPPPVERMDDHWSGMEQALTDHMLAVSAVGSPEMVRRGLERIIEQTGADEIIATTHIFDHGARLRSFEILARIWPVQTVSGAFS